MKKPVKASAKAKQPSEELKRWCIEIAARWPTHHEPAFGGSHPIGQYVPSTPPRVVEADLIGRAKKILEWVQS